MTTRPRVDWRFAVGCAAVLASLFAMQQWIAPPAGRPDLALGTAFALQAVTWGLWLLLLPLIIGSARRHPLEAQPSAGWVLRFALEAAAFALLHGALGGALRWALGLAISSELGTAVLNSVVVTFASNVLRYAAILTAYQAFVYH